MADNNTEESLIIKVNNNNVSEKYLIESKQINTLLFESLMITFSAALILQLFSLIPSSYNLRNFVPVIVLVVLSIGTIILIVLKKQPTIKTYLYLIALLIGLVIGV